MRHALLLVAIALTPACLAQVITDPNFVVETISTPGHGTIGIDFGPDGRMYVAEKRGRILVLQRNLSGGYDQPTEFADLVSSVYYTGESGMLGLALDPDFATNRYIYLFYTTASDQRLVRVQADASYNQISGGQTVLLSGLPRVATNHKAGDIGFRPGEPENIYISLGDDANIGQVTNMDVYHGKMLRVNKTNGEGLTTNPWYVAASGTTSVRSRIWAFGFRNPFRIAFHPANPVPNAIYSSENGGPGGVTLQDRITWIQQGANAGWNTTASSAGNGSEFYNPVNPAGQECAVMFRDTSSLIGIDIAAGGVFADPAHPGSAVLMCSNWLANSGTIYRWRISGSNHNVLEPMAIDGGLPFIRQLYATDMKFGPDGWLYFTQAVNGISSGTTYRIGRIRTIGNVAPVAGFSTNPDPATGPAPFNVQFNDTSTDVDGTIVSWNWNFGNGQTSTQQNPSMQFNTHGVYNVVLTVTDDDAAQHFTQRTVTVRARPVASFTSNPTPAVGPGPLNVAFTDTSTDADGTIVSRSWILGNGQTSTAAAPATIYSTPGVYNVTLTVTDNHGLQDVAQGSVTVYARPVASFTMNPDPATGPAPLNVQFTDTSTDSDGNITAWNWDFGNGQFSTLQHPAMNFATPGSFNVSLTVTDNHGLAHNIVRFVNAYFATALTLSGQVMDARTLTPVPLATATELRLYAADGITPITFPGGTGASQNGISVATGGSFNITVQVQLAANGVVVSAGEPAADGMAAKRIGFPVAASAPTHTQALTFNLSSLAVAGRITSGAGNATVDIGVARVSPTGLYEFVGARDYLPASGIPATGVAHRVQSDALGFYYIPMLHGGGAADLFLDVVGDTGTALFVATASSEFLPAGGLVLRDFMLAPQSAAGTREDLAAVPVTPNVDFASRIQPIFNATCASCHAAANPRGGLALDPTGSLSALVNAFSVQATTMRLVEPGNAMQSYLFEKINAHQPQFGVRMAQGATLTPVQQALIRDWINQGALPAASPPPDDDGGKSSGCSVGQATGSLWIALGSLGLLLARRRKTA